MKYSEVLEILDDLHEEQREMLLAAVISQLSDYSLYTIVQFELDWEASGSFDDYRKRHNELIKECIRIETSLYGTIIRRSCNLEPLELNSELRWV